MNILFNFFYLSKLHFVVLILFYFFKPFHKLTFCLNCAHKSHHNSSFICGISRIFRSGILRLTHCLTPAATETIMCHTLTHTHTHTLTHTDRDTCNKVTAKLSRLFKAWSRKLRIVWRTSSSCCLLPPSPSSPSIPRPITF